MINLNPDGLAIGSLLAPHAACIGIVLIKRISISELDEANFFSLKEKYDCKQIPDISYFVFLRWTICGVILEPHYCHDFCQTQNRFMATTHDRVLFDVPKALHVNGTTMIILDLLFSRSSFNHVWWNKLMRFQFGGISFDSRSIYHLRFFRRELFCERFCVL